VFVDDGPQGGVLVQWEATEEVLELGGEEDLDEEGQELGEGSVEGDEGFDWVAGAGVDGSEDELEVQGQVLSQLL
jgi:hypothetical protein